LLDPRWMAPGHVAVQIAKLQRQVKRLVAERGWGKVAQRDASPPSALPSS
jgi:hypothetical protein